MGDTVQELDQLEQPTGTETTRVILPDQNLIAASLPEQLWSLTSVTHLNLARNKLSDISPAITQLFSLRYLNLSQNQLSHFPASITTLQALEDLDLSRNYLHEVPSAIGSLSALQHLNLMNNQLTSIPPALGNLSLLYRLGLKGNQLTALPDSIAGLKGLVEMFITDNQLVALPDGMSGLTSLVKLQVSICSLSPLAGLSLLACWELAAGRKHAQQHATTWHVCADCLCNIGMFESAQDTACCKGSRAKARVDEGGGKCH